MYVKGHQDEKDNICFLFCDRCFVASTGFGGGSGASVGNLNKKKTLKFSKHRQNTTHAGSMLRLIEHSDLEYTEGWYYTQAGTTLRLVVHSCWYYTRAGTTLGLVLHSGS